MIYPAAKFRILHKESWGLATRFWSGRGAIIWGMWFLPEFTSSAWKRMMGWSTTS